MRTLRLGAVFGAMWLLGSCVPVDDDPPVQGSKQLQQLSGHEIVYLCDWATDYMGGALSNPEGASSGEGIYHRCPADISTPDGEETYISFNYQECPQLLASEAAKGCTLTANDFVGWIRAIADTPCEHHYVSNAECELLWFGNEEGN